MRGFRSLSTRLVLAMLIPLTALLLLATWIENRRASAVLIETGENAAANLGATVKEELQGVLRSTKTGMESLALGLTLAPALQENQVQDLLRQAVEQAPLLYGSALAFESNDATGPPLAPYVFREGDQLTARSLATNEYRYREQPWFTAPLERGEALWTAPYLDDGGGNTRMVTYAVPVNLAGRRAVLTGDMALDFLSEIASSSLLGRPGAVLVFDATGQLIAHPRNEWVLNKTLAEIAGEQQLPALRKALPAVKEEQELWLRPDDGMHSGLLGEPAQQAGRLLIVPLKEAGWGIGIYFSDDAFLADSKSATRFRLAFSALLLVLLTATLAMVALRSLRPLGELAERTRAIARGELQGQTPGQERRDEVGRLSRAFHQMQDHLQKYIEDLTRATVAQERLDAELTTARLLQQSLLPPTDPDPAVLGADLVAALKSARQVGGDLFNYQRRSEKNLFFVVGDVSDTGVPAALFMTRANALLKAAASSGGDPGEVLGKVNRSLSEENELCMFVTLLAGEMNLESGELVLASAGHEAPVLVRSDGHAEFLTLDQGPPVGLDQHATFPLLQCKLAPGDCLVTFTDGLSEARAPDGESFGKERLLTTLQSAQHDSAGELLSRIQETVAQFAAGQEATDDMTVLILRRATST